jgi:hypothetical protein
MNTVGRRAFLAAIALIAPTFRVSTRAQSFSVDDFLALSSRLTGYDNLDRETAGIFLKHLLATPGNAVRLARPDAALERDIIVAWYTGVHEVRGEARLVTHSGALQWRALGMPAPGTCVGPFGSWAKPHRPSQP